MRIAQVGSYPLSEDYICGGVEASVFGLTLALAQIGHSVEVFDYPRIGGEDTCEYSKNIIIHRYSNAGRHNQSAIKRTTDICRDILASQPDVVHIHGTGIVSGALYRLAKSAGISVILTVHGLLREEKRKALLRQPSLKHIYQYIVQARAEKALLNAASPVIVDTQYVAQRIERYYDKYRLRQMPELHVIPQGINAEFFNHPCDEISRTILCVGTITPRKGHIYTVDMFNRLKEWGINTRLRVIGAKADTAYYNRLKQYIQRSPYCNDISLETDVSQAELLSAYEHAKLFVLHSAEESQGIVFAQAMACGLPVVAANVGGVGNVVEHGRTGFLCDFGDTLTMAQMVKQLLSDDDLCKSFSGQARKAALKYNWNTIAEQILRLYKG